MSAECMAWVFRCSPLKGAAFQVHVAVADSVNDQHGYELWMRQGVLATKARVSRKATNAALATMQEIGLLALLEQGSGGANRYRFLMPDLAVVYDPRVVTTGAKGVNDGDRRVSPPVTPPTHEGVTHGYTEPKGLTQEGTQGEPSTTRGAANAVSITNLCNMLATSIELHRGGTSRPRVSKAWERDMRLLIERGPLGLDGARGLGPDVIARAIAFVFEHLADPGRDGFCWADQVQSPNALRRHWPKLVDAKRKSEQGGGVSKGAKTIDRVARRLAEQRPALELLAGGNTQTQGG